ncbi:alpha/beta hydrolase [Bradyrhizobium liaoningense]
MTHRSFGTSGLVLVLFVFMAATSIATAAERVGVLLMHGKRGSAKHVQELADNLRGRGYLVITPDMPWSKSRAYDKSLPDSHREIDVMLDSLRARGATRLVVAGHSMGANMAIGYAATDADVDAVMAFGPGQTVESKNFLDVLGPSVSKAKDLVSAGRADDPVEFLDLHLGKTSRVEVTPGIYLSYFDPDGLANMPMMVMKISIPLLWTVGSLDKNMLDRGQAYAFDRAVQNPLSRYAVVNADHMGTPSASIEVAIEWLSQVFSPSPSRSGE